MNEIEQYFKELNIDIKDLRNFKLLLQQNNDLLESGLRSNNVTSFRTIDTFNAQDSLDATYPMYLYLNINDDMTKIVSIKLSFWLLPFRAYETAAKSGGGSTSGAGGGQTSSAGRAQTSSAGGAQTSGGGGDDVTAATGHSSIRVASSTLAAHEGGYYHVSAAGADVSRQDHTHSQLSHTHSVANHTHTVANHTHTVADHTHTTPAHTHDITFGIYEEDNSPTIGVSISRDNGETYGNVLGTYTDDVSNLEIKDYIEKAGSYIIRFTSTARARISAQITMKLDIVAR